MPPAHHERTNRNPASREAVRGAQGGIMPRAVPMPRFYVTRVLAHARWRGYRGSNSFFVDNQGASPLSTLWRPSGTLILPRHTPRGISTRLQSERSYLRSKVPDGVSHLFPCTAGALFPEANSLLLPLPVTPAGRSSPWAQPILHYERKRVLQSARKSGLRDEQREFFSTPRHTHAPLYATRVLTHARLRG